MPIQDWGITGAGDRALLRQVRIHRGRLRQGRQHQGPDPAGRQSVRGSARARLSQSAAGRQPCEQAVRQGRDRARLSSLPAADRQRLAALHQPRRHEARAVPVLRLLRALRLRGERQGQSAHHRHPGGAAQSECGPAHLLLGHQGAHGLHRQEGDRRRLRQRADRRGDRAAGRPRDPLPPMACPTCT